MCFRRTVDDRMLEMLSEACQLALTIVFRWEDDALVWYFTSNGIYSIPSLYKVINFRGV